MDFGTGIDHQKFRFNRLRDALAFYVAGTTADQLDPQRVRLTFDEYQHIWEDLGTSWVRFREQADQ